MTLVLVTGPPASGKTTLARPLAFSLGLPLLGKDTIKEALFDTLGNGDRSSYERPWPGWVHWAWAAQCWRSTPAVRWTSPPLAHGSGTSSGGSGLLAESVVSTNGCSNRGLGGDVRELAARSDGACGPKPF
ncbi:MAG TPA: AAA family ATPase [Actinomycetes bacterium]